MTRARLLAEADSEELGEWMEYDRVRGPTVQDRLLARLCTLIAQFGGNKRAKPEDYLREAYPLWEPPRRGRLGGGGGTTITFRGGRKRRED